MLKPSLQILIEQTHTGDHFYIMWIIIVICTLYIFEKFEFLLKFKVEQCNGFKLNYSLNIYENNIKNIYYISYIHIFMQFIL